MVDKDLKEMLDVMIPGRWYPFLSDQDERIVDQLVSRGSLERREGVLGISYRKPRPTKTKVTP